MPQPRSNRRLGRGVALKSQSKCIIMNVHKKITEENPFMSCSQIQDRVADLCGVSVGMVRKIKTESNKLQENENFSTPGKCRKRTKTKVKIDNFQRCALRNIVYNFHIQHKTLPTLKKLLSVLKTEHQDLQIDCTHETLRKILRDLGFRWKKTENNRKILIEKHDIRFKRVNYLKQMKIYRREERPIIFSDESYIHSTHSKNYSWTDNSNNGFKKSFSKGSKLVLVHAGSNAGEVQNALLIFKSGQKKGEYQNNMNAENYEKWLKTKLIPNLPPRSVLVIDNARYHNVKLNKAPNSNNKKQELLDWLINKNIPCSPDMLKTELYELVRLNKPRYEEYYFDKILEDCGHNILRLPPYHPELNPIELVWAKIKGEVAADNVRRQQKIEEVKEITEKKFSELPAEYWKQCCEHSLKIEQNYYDIDRVADMQTERFLIADDGSSSSDESADELCPSDGDDTDYTNSDDMSGIESLD